MKVPFSTLSDKEFKIQSVINYALIFAVIWGGIFDIAFFISFEFMFIAGFLFSFFKRH